MTELDDMCRSAILGLQEACAKRYLSFDALCERLRRGCSVFAALNMPCSWEVREVIQDSGNRHYSIAEPVPAETTAFDGTERELREFLEEKEKEQHIK